MTDPTTTPTPAPAPVYPPLPDLSQQLAMLPATGISDALQQAFTTLNRSVLDACNAASLAGLTPALLCASLMYHQVLIQGVLDLAITQAMAAMNAAPVAPPPSDPTADSLAALESAAKASLAAIQTAEAAHAQQVAPAAPAPPAAPIPAPPSVN